MGKNSEEITSPQFTKQIGTTTYVVNVHFPEESNAPTIEDKLLRLMEHGDIRLTSILEEKTSDQKLGA